MLDNRDTIAANTGNGELDQMIAKYARLVLSIAIKYNVVYDDALQEGLLGIVDAYNNFGAKKRKKLKVRKLKSGAARKRCSGLTTFVWYCIRNRLLAYKRQKARIKNCILLFDNQLFEQVCGNVTAYDRHEFVEEEQRQKEIDDARAEVQELLLQCSPLEQKVMRHYFLDGMTHRQIAKKLNFSLQYSSLIIRTAIEKLRIKHGPPADLCKLARVA